MATATTIEHVEETSNNVPVFGVVVRAYLQFGQFDGTNDEFVLSARTQSRSNGYWSLDLKPNETISPAGSWYLLRMGDRRVTIRVPNDGLVYDLDDDFEDLYYDPGIPIPGVPDDGFEVFTQTLGEGRVFSVVHGLGRAVHVTVTEASSGVERDVYVSHPDTDTAVLSFGFDIAAGTRNVNIS